MTEKQQLSIQPNISKISGFPNYSEEEHYFFSQWVDHLTEAFKKFGFSNLSIPPIEYIDNLQLKGGLTKQIYRVARLQDGTLTDLGLPFDRTVPLALFIARHENEITFPYKRQDISWVFRGEHPQAGRFRGFIQADVDILDRKRDILDDCSCISAIIAGLQSLDIPTFFLCLNQLEISRSLLRAKGVLEKDFPDVMRFIDKLEKLTDKQIEEEGEKLLGKSFDDQFVQIFRYKGTIDKFPFLHLLDDQGKAGLEELTKVFDYLKALGVVDIDLLFSPCMVRGLDYYTGVIFESFLLGLEKFGSIASGGRYDSLVTAFSKKKNTQEIGGVGGSIGLTRLFDILKREKKITFTRCSAVDIAIIPRSIELLSRSIEVTKELRSLGYNVDLICKKNVTKGLDFCNRKGIPAAVMVMDENELVVKDLLSQTQDSGADIQAIRPIIEAISF